MIAGKKIWTLILGLSLITIPAFNQGTFIKVHPDSTMTLSIYNYRGDLQWQKSVDETSWTDIQGAHSNKIIIQGIDNFYYRISVKELFCDWIHSDWVKLLPVTPATINTSGHSIIHEDTVRCSGDIINTGNDPELLRGFCWSLLPEPDTSDLLTYSGIGGGFYSDTIFDLMPDTVYYMRAFAHNFVGISYGQQDTIRTGIYIPRLTTERITVHSDSTATGEGLIIMIGGSMLTEAGICWDTTPIPNINSSHHVSTTPGNPFTAPLINLDAVTTYYARAYAINAAGIGYGDTISFATPAGPPDVITLAPHTITTNSFIAGGDVTSAEGDTVKVRGICWGVQHNPDLSNNVIIVGDSLGSFETEISGLTIFSTYYYRAYATNGLGTKYGAEQMVTTRAELPVVTTHDITNITTTSATSGGTVTYTGGAPLLEQGICWSTTTDPDTTANHWVDPGTGNPFSTNITGIDPNTQYFVRAYAVNDEGISYGSSKTFTTLIASPQVTTYGAADITYKTAKLTGKVTDAGGGNVSERGFYWSTQNNPDLTSDHLKAGSGEGDFELNLTGLSAGITYYVKSYAKNQTGTVLGNQITFKTGNRQPFVSETTIPSNITASTAETGGTATDAGGGTIFSRGICIDKNPLPDQSKQGTSDGTGIGTFTSHLGGLDPNTQYYIRAFAKNSIGTAYGPQRTFKTRDDGSYRNVPVLTNSVRASFKGWGDAFPDRGTLPSMGYSGITFDWERNLLYIVGNNTRYIWVIQAPGFGNWNDNNPDLNFVRSIELQGFTDPEAINYLGNSWLMVTEEGERKIYLFAITAATTVINKADPGVVVDPTEMFALNEAKSIGNQLEGIAFDFFNRKVYALCEIGILNTPRIFMWDWDDTNHKVIPGTRQELTDVLEDFTNDFEQASDLFFSPLLRRLFVVDGFGNKIGEYDCWDPASTNFGYKLSLMTEPLSAGTTGTDLGDCEGFCLSRDGRYLYLCFEDKGFGYAPVGLIRNVMDEGLTEAQYPMAGTPGTHIDLDPMIQNDPQSYLSLFTGLDHLPESSLLSNQFDQLTLKQGTTLANGKGIAYEENDDRFYIIKEFDAQTPIQTYIYGFDMDGSAARQHTLIKGFGLQADGSFKPAVTRSSASELVIDPFSNVRFIWNNGLDGSTLRGDLIGIFRDTLINNYLEDANETLLLQGLDAGVILQNLYEGMAIDPIYRNCIWTIRKTSFKIEEYRSNNLVRQIAIDDLEVENTGKTIREMTDEIKGMYYNDLSNHLFILGRNTSTEISYIFEMNMFDRSIIGILELPEPYAEAISFDHSLQKMLILYSNGTNSVQIYERD